MSSLLLLFFFLNFLYFFLLFLGYRCLLCVLLYVFDVVFSIYFDEVVCIVSGKLIGFRVLLFMVKEKLEFWVLLLELKGFCEVMVMWLKRGNLFVFIMKKLISFFIEVISEF